MMDKKLDPQLKMFFEKMAQVKERDPQRAAQTRASYLANLRVVLNNQPRVSPTPLQRLNGWIDRMIYPLQRKERFSMATILSSILVIGALLFGGAGATVYAAQQSMPDDFLFPLKALAEDMRLEMVGDSQAQLQLALEFTNRRMEEVEAMLKNGEMVPEQAADRLQLHLNLALQLAAGMDDQQMQPALQQIRSVIQQQQQLLVGVGGENAQLDATLARIRSTLQNQAQMCQEGLENPLLFRQRYQQQYRHQQPVTTEQPPEITEEPSVSSTEAPGSGNDNSNGTPVQDGTGAGYGPNPEPGAGGCTDCEPLQDGTGPGPGPNPEPGDSNPGPGNDNVTPPQDGSGGGNGTSPGNNTNPAPTEPPGSGGGGGGGGGGGKP